MTKINEPLLYKLNSTFVFLNKSLLPVLNPKRNRLIVLVVGLVLLLIVVGCFNVLKNKKNIIQYQYRVGIETTPRYPATCESPLPTKDLKIKTKKSAVIYPNTNCTFANRYVLITELDKATCKSLNEFTIVDKNNVYTHNYDRASGTSDTYRIENKANSKTLVYLGYGYFRDYQYLFYDEDGVFKIIEDIDLNSIEVLSTHFIKDKNYVYYNKAYGGSTVERRVLTNLDPITFSAIQNEENYESYFRDKNGVYFVNLLSTELFQKIEGVDIDSFQVLLQYKLAKDKNHVYINNEMTDAIDASSFELLNEGYSRDKYGVYSGVGYSNLFRQLHEADPCTFEIIGYKNQYEWCGYSKDKKHVYFRDELVAGSDPESFTVIYKNDPGPDDCNAFDKNYEYQGKFRAQDLPSR